MVRINTGLPPTGKNCLGNIPSHTQPFASCNYNDMPVHSAIIIPCFNSVTFSAPTYFSAMANENAIAAPGPLPVIKLPSFSTKAAVYSAPSRYFSNPG